jgi:hypothetical protein
MNKSMNAQTPLPSKSDGEESIYKVCKSNVLRTSLAAIEADITIPTVKSRTSLRLTEEQQLPRPLNASEREKLERDREALCSGFESSRFLRGELLFKYRAAYRGSKLWMKAVQAIADSEGVHANSIRNLIKDYEVAVKLPETVRSAFNDQGIDPAKKKNHIVVERVINRLQSSSGPKEPNQEQASQIVIEEMMKIPVAPDLSDVSEGLNADEKLLHRIRKAIRGAVVNVPRAKRLEAVKAALEEEMFEVWGQRESITVTLTPHRSAITFEGRKLKSDERTQEVAA